MAREVVAEVRRATQKKLRFEGKMGFVLKRLREEIPAISLRAPKGPLLRSARSLFRLHCDRIHPPNTFNSVISLTTPGACHAGGAGFWSISPSWQVAFGLVSDPWNIFNHVSSTKRLMRHESKRKTFDVRAQLLGE